MRENRLGRARVRIDAEWISEITFPLTGRFVRERLSSNCAKPVGMALKGQDSVCWQDLERWLGNLVREVGAMHRIRPVAWGGFRSDSDA